MVIDVGMAPLNTRTFYQYCTIHNLLILLRIVACSYLRRLSMNRAVSTNVCPYMKLPNASPKDTNAVGHECRGVDVKAICRKAKRPTGAQHIGAVVGCIARFCLCLGGGLHCLFFLLQHPLFLRRSGG